MPIISDARMIMPRIARTVLPDVPLHVIQRGNNKQPCFLSEQDYRYYLKLLCTYAPETGCLVHAYVIMTNHVHMLATSPTKAAISTMMKAVGQRYAQYFNRKYDRCGTLWQGRFRSSPTQTQEYFLACQRYIELNPVRARMVAEPSAYPWSSYRANSRGRGDELVTPHPIYIALGDSDRARQVAYRALFAAEISEDVMNHIRRACKGQSVLGTAAFAASIAAATGNHAIVGRRVGRPRKNPLPL